MRKLVTDKKILRQVSEPIEKIDDKELAKLIDKMEKVLVANKGIGLAGVQIGVHKQIFVMYSPDGGIEVVINPKIISSYWQNFMMLEGCLSLPKKKWFTVGRPKKVKSSYLNAKAEIVEKEFKDEFAVLFQHEYDHLLGKLYIDYK